MRPTCLVILLATMTSILHADGSDAVVLPGVDAGDWKPELSQDGSLAEGKLVSLHKTGYEALADLSLPVEKGLDSYTRMAAILAGSHEVEAARNAYMDLINELAYFSIGRNIELVPDDMLDGAATLARTNAEKSLIHFLTAWRLADSKFPERRARAGTEFAKATAIESPQLHEQMLLRYLKWSETDGISKISEKGELTTEADYEKAVEICAEIAATAKNHDVIDYAVNCEKCIRNPAVDLDVANAFRTGSQAQFAVKWRNCDEVEISLYSLKLDQTPLTNDATDLKKWAASIVLPDDAEPVRRITMNTRPQRKYYPVRETARMDDLLLPGAYLVKVSSGDYHAEDILFITDSVLVVKVGKDKVLTFACNAQTGKPMSGAEITLWARKTNDPQWVRLQKNTGSDGVSVFSGKEIGQPENAAKLEYLAILSKDQQQALSFYLPKQAAGTNAVSWSARLFTDSDDYMPGNTVHILSLVRKNSDGIASIVPQDEINLKLSGPEGFEPVSVKTQVDKYGMANADIVLPDGIPTGIYAITLLRASDGRQAGDPCHFSVHGSYSPDYKIALNFDHGTDNETFILGGLLKGTVRVTSPYGEQVTGQAVEIQIDERLYDIKTGRNIGEWKSVSHNQTRTNARGEASFSYQTHVAGNNNFELRVKALVADSNDSPSVAATTILATVHGIYASLHTDGVLYEQGKGVRLRLETRSAKGVPIACKGTLRLIRESWKEVWTDRRGHEISGEEIQEMRKHGGGWLGFGQNAGDYVLKSQGYMTETVLEESLDSSVQGSAYYVWENAKPGYYHFVWLGENGNASVVSCEQAFWVSGKDSDIIGFRPDKMMLVSDHSDTDDGSGRTMITVPTTNQSVLVTEGGDELKSWKLVNLKGTAQTIETKPSSSRHTEYLEALSVSDERIETAFTLLSKPKPTGLIVSISNDRTDYEPGENASFTVVVSDHDGTPVENARVFFWITGTTEDATAEPEELFPPLPPKIDAITSGSTMAKPFFRPIVGNDKPDGDGRSCRETSAQTRNHVSSNAHSSDVAEPPTAETAVWITDGISDRNGNVHFNVKMPRVISRWRVEAVASEENGAAGVTRVHATTNEPLETSLNAPESIFAGDIVNVTAIVANNQASDTSILFSMFCKGMSPSQQAFTPVYMDIDPYSSRSAKWLLSFENTGHTRLLTSAKTSDKIVNYSTEVFVKPNPTFKTYSHSGFANSPELTLPDPPANSRLISVDYALCAAPSHATLGALPYLLSDKSSGSTEAAARVATVSSLRRLFGRMHFSETAINKGLARCGVVGYEKKRLAQDIEVLQSTQAENGAWGWIDSAYTDGFTTAYNLIMLNLCDGEVAEKLAPTLARARTYAASELVDESQNADLRAMLLFGLASRGFELTRPSRLEARALVNLIRAEDELSPLALACLALSAKQYGFDDEASGIAAHIRSKAQIAENPAGQKLAYWRGTELNGAIPASEVESSAMSLLALVSANGSKDAFVEQAVRFIYEKSVDGHWDGPRETALCTFALRDLSAVSSETDLEAKCAIVANGKNIGEYNSAEETDIRPPVWKIVPKDGNNLTESIEVRRISGDSPVFASVRAVYDCGISTSEHSSITGLKISRKYLMPVQVPTLLNGADERVAEMDTMDSVHVGERLESVITLSVDHNIPELLLEQEMPKFMSWHDQSTAPTVTCVGDVDKKPGVMRVMNSDGALMIGFEMLPAGKWEIRYPVKIDYAGEFTVPAAKVWIPQRNSLSAESDMLRIKCVSGTNADSPSEQ